MKAVCVGDQWVGPDGRIWRVLHWVGASEVLMGRPDGDIVVAVKLLEHEDGWRWLKPRSSA